MAARTACARPLPPEPGRANPSTDPPLLCLLPRSCTFADWKCGGPGMSAGVGFPTQGTTNGKCGLWGGGLDPGRFPNNDGTPNRRYSERCCPWTDRGSRTVGFHCHDLPFGASCTEANQCADPYVCGYNNTCHFPLAPGEPCCNPNNGQGCHDFLCGPRGANKGIGWPGMSDPTNGKCGRWDIDNDYDNLGPGYQERCCPPGQGSEGSGEECHRIPAGGSCKEANQCDVGLVCGHNRTCHVPLPVGSPCCDDNGNNCHEYAPPPLLLLLTPSQNRVPSQPFAAACVVD
jgi:hypothetical protein